MILALIGIFSYFSGAVGARLSTDASSVRSLVGDTLSIAVQNLSTVLAGLVISFTANWMLSFIILCVLPLVFLQGYFQMKFLSGFSADAKVGYINSPLPRLISSLKWMLGFTKRPSKFHDRLCTNKQVKLQVMQLAASELLLHFVQKRRWWIHFKKNVKAPWNKEFDKDLLVVLVMAFLSLHSSAQMPSASI